MSRKKYILYMRWISVEILLTFRKVKVGKMNSILTKWVKVDNYRTVKSEMRYTVNGSRECLGGGIGRRKGLKIPRGFHPVPVQIRP
jgi:hypothetical protein